MNDKELLGRKGLTIVYDKECPFCSNFADFYRLKSRLERVELVNAREHPNLLKELLGQGKDLNEGMLVYWAGRAHYGADAMHTLAIISSSGGVFNSINRFLFTHQRISAALYPVLVFLRKITLIVLRRSPLK
ncbi:MAG: putative DCC family thiol-disulfide oxidoreductase YuxK [Cryomorphaceae bacterium]